MIVGGWTLISWIREVGRLPSECGLQAAPEDTLQPVDSLEDAWFSLGQEINDPVGFSSTETSPTLVSESSPLEPLGTDSGAMDMPDLSLPSVVESARPSVSPQYSLNDYLGDYLRSDMQRKAKERRMKRMAIIRMKRKAGQISFFGPKIRYENKRRVLSVCFIIPL